ncbi:MAG: hypothetical protein ACK5OB_15215 [Pirellula sp.]
MPRPGERVIELFHQLGASVPQAALSDEEFVRIKEYLIRKSGGESIDEAFLIFLRDVLRADAYDGKIISVNSGKSFIETQANGALTELPPDSGFVQFAYWDGDSGGDAWIYDLRYRCIRCITASIMGPHSMADVRAYSYGVFFHYDWFPSYLRGVAESRGWIRMGGVK